MNNKTQSYNFLPAFIVGAIEGLIVTLALFCFLIGKGLPALDVFLYGVIAAIFICVLLGIGAYYTRKEELLSSKGESKIMKIYQALDIDETLKKEMVNDTLDEKKQWEQEWNQSVNATENLTPVSYASSIVSGFLSGSIIVTANNYFMHLPDYAALAIPFLLLCILGFWKYRQAGKNPATGILLIGLSGMLAAFGAYYAGGLF